MAKEARKIILACEECLAQHKEIGAQKVLPKMW